MVKREDVVLTPAIKKISAKIAGISPLLMNRFPLEEENVSRKSMEEQIELALYRTPSGEIYFPGTNLQRSLISGGAFLKKGRGNRSKDVAACVFITPENLVLNNQEYVIDMRAVVNPMTKGRLIKSRPKFENWELTFELEFDESLFSEIEIRSVVDFAGSRVGIGDFRPEKKGSFGRFVVIAWNKC